MINLGNLTEDQVIDFMWNTAGASGASITRSTNGTISVYKANSTTQSTAGITDTEDFDSLTGVHHCRIDTSADAFYAVNNDYMVVLSGAVVDGVTINAVIATFSIENRFNEVDVVKISGDATAADNAESFFDGTGYAGTGNTIPTVTTLTGNTAQTGDNFARIGAPVGASISADVAAVKAQTVAIEADTTVIGATGGGLTSLATQASISALNNISAAQVNAEVVDVLTVDTYASDLSAPPAATSTILAKLSWLFMLGRNKRTSTSTQEKLYKDDATTVAGTSTVSDDGTTATRGEYA